MNRYFLSIVVVVMLVFQGCGSSVRVFHDIDPAADFTKYGTYNFLSWSQGNLKTINEMERERLKVAFARELESRGLVFKPEEADVSVQITVFHREKSNAYGSSPYGYPYGYPYYSPYYGGYPRVYNYLERAISVDIYDNSVMKHVWHSAAVGELDYNPQERDKNLPGITSKMFEDFPIKAPEKI